MLNHSILIAYRVCFCFVFLYLSLFSLFPSFLFFFIFLLFFFSLFFAFPSFSIFLLPPFFSYPGDLSGRGYLGGEAAEAVEATATNCGCYSGSFMAADAAGEWPRNSLQ